MHRFLTKSLAALGLAAIAGTAAAQTVSYPAKPVRILNPFAAGGSGDIVTRIVTAKITENTGKTFVQETRTGAGGRIGYEAGTRAAADGYTVILSDTTFTMLPALHANAQWATPEALAPVTVLAISPFLIVVQPALAANTLGELIQYAKANPGKLNYGSAGNGTINHVTTELFKREAGIDMTHVPYKGMGDAITGLLTGSVDVIILGILPISPHVNAGKAKPMAIAARQRSPGLPNVPSVVEAGLPGFLAGNWFGWTAPAGTPREAIDWLQKEAARALAAPEVRERLVAQAVEPSGMAPEEMGKLMREDFRRWADVVRAARIKAE